MSNFKNANNPNLVVFGNGLGVVDDPQLSFLEHDIRDELTEYFSDCLQSKAKPGNIYEFNYQGKRGFLCVIKDHWRDRIDPTALDKVLTDVTIKTHASGCAVKMPVGMRDKFILRDTGNDEMTLPEFFTGLVEKKMGKTSKLYAE